MATHCIPLLAAADAIAPGGHSVAASLVELGLAPSPGRTLSTHTHPHTHDLFSFPPSHSCQRSCS